MITISFNGEPQKIDSIEALGEALTDFDDHDRFELWCNIANGPSMCMFRNAENAFLMYLRSAGDQGVVSQGDRAAKGTVEYTLANGQIDEHPAFWSIEIEQCYKAIAYFYVNDGLQPEWISWHETQ